MYTISLNYQKHKGGAGINGLGRHNERKPGQKHGNKNIRGEDTHKNLILIKKQGTYTKRIDDVIKEQYKGTRAIRKDAVKLVTATVQLGESTQDWDMERKIDSLLKAFSLLVNEHGKENVISACIHVDETNPHLHFDFVPMIGGKLSAKRVLGGKEQLKQTQDKFLENMREFTGEDFRRKSDMTFNGLTQEMNDRLWKERIKLEQEKKKHEQIIKLKEMEQLQKDQQLQKKETELLDKQEKLTTMLSDAKKRGLQNGLRENRLNTLEKDLNARERLIFEKESSLKQMLENVKKMLEKAKECLKCAGFVYEDSKNEVKQLRLLVEDDRKKKSVDNWLQRHRDTHAKVADDVKTLESQYNKYQGPSL